MKGIMLIADYFEDIEGLGTLDLLSRAGIKCDLVSITGKKKIVTQSNVIMETDFLFEDIKLNDYSFLIIPGGKAVLLTHHDSQKTKEAVSYFNNRQALIATICAAPSILGKLNILDNKEYVCFPGFEKFSKLGKYQQDKKVVKTGNYITARAAGSTFEFAYAIITYLVDEELAKKVINSVYY